jgi:hypothetical protein
MALDILCANLFQVSKLISRYLYRPQSAHICSGHHSRIDSPQSSNAIRNNTRKAGKDGLDVSKVFHVLDCARLRLFSGNVLVIASTAALVVALTWGGVFFPWSSFHVLVPLILGAAGMVVFLVYEARFAKHPIVS